MNITHRITRKIRRIIRRIFLRPLPVFVFHHVSEICDPLICDKNDWTQIETFKRNIRHLQQRYKFISLQEAIDHLRNDNSRFKDYAVLTADDGLRSTYELLPWLKENNIPITLFICPKYLDGKSYIPIDEQRVHAQYPNADMTEIASRMFISQEEVDAITSPLVTIASHGYEHLDASILSDAQFVDDVISAQLVLSKHPLYKPYFAYPWGRRSATSDNILAQQDIIPILCDGRGNECWTGAISRKCIDNMTL